MGLTSTPHRFTDENRNRGRARQIAERQHRAAYRVQLKAGALTFAELLEIAADDRVVAKFRLVDVVKVVAGPVRGPRLLTEARVPTEKRGKPMRLYHLGPAQKARLLDALG